VRKGEREREKESAEGRGLRGTIRKFVRISVANRKPEL